MEELKNIFIKIGLAGEYTNLYTALYGVAKNRSPERALEWSKVLTAELSDAISRRGTEDVRKALELQAARITAMATNDSEMHAKIIEEMETLAEKENPEVSY